MAKDYYKILGVPRTTEEKEIKSAYRRLARKYHPDVNPNDPAAEARFKEVSEAYEVIGNPEKRKLYDQFGAHWEHAQNFSGGTPSEQGGYSFRFGGPGAGGTGAGGAGGGAGGFESIFEQIFSNFGGGGAGTTQGSDFDFETFHVAEPRDVEKVVELPLTEVDRGTTRTLTYQTMDAVRSRGTVSTVPSTKKVEVKIPAGIPDGKKLRVQGKGAMGANGKAGDLYVTIRWQEHPDLKPSGEHLEVEVPVSFTVAALGGEVRVPTLGGTVMMKVPAGTQSGQAFRLAGQGITRLGGGKRDLYAKVKITVPKVLTDEERQLLRKLADLEVGRK
jgi:DnaJ-class molecular chaperone